jgi:hypothetical protein
LGPQASAALREQLTAELKDLNCTEKAANWARRVLATKNSLTAADAEQIEQEAAITADYEAQSAVERELVLRLASVLWRLRRATTMETGLFEIQAEQLRGYRQNRQVLPDSSDIIHPVFRRADSVTAPLKAGAPAVEFARCFLRMANLPNFAIDRLSRYEAALWRRAGRILLSLDALDRRKPQERRRRFFFGSGQEARKDCCDVARLPELKS